MVLGTSYNIKLYRVKHTEVEALILFTELKGYCYQPSGSCPRYKAMYTALFLPLRLSLHGMK